MDIPRTPPDLGTIGSKTWKKLHMQFDLTSIQDMERTRLVCKTLDDESEHMKTVEKEGRYVRDRWGQVKEHPALKAARECRVLFCRIIRDMGIDLREAEDSRPPRQY